MLRRLYRHLRTNTTPVGTGGAGLLLVLVAGACGHGHHDATLPTASAPTAPSVSASPTSVEDAVKQTYSQYWVVLPQAEQAATPDRRRQLLADYATQPLLGQVLSNIDKLHSKHLTSSGYVVVHVERVQVSGSKATVWDCQDSTRALLKNTSTGQVTSRGTPNDHLQATLTRGSDGRWRISKFSPLGRC
jgi:hypothetical protein